MKQAVQSLRNPKTHKPLRTTAFATASIVTGLSVAERGLGFLYRIVLSHLLGGEGLGLYQVALSVFAVFLTVGTGGIPITVSRLISKSKAENNHRGESGAVSAGVCACLLLTLPVCLLFGFFPNLASFLFTDERGVAVFRILLIGLCFSSLYAVFRGSFWGNQRFLLPSVLEIAEESVMVIAGILLLRNVQNATQGANLAAWAVVISYVFSFTASLLCFLFCGGRLSHPQKQLKPLFSAAIPITSVRASGTLVNSAVAVLLPAMLVRAGYKQTEALRLFGVVSGMAMPVLFIPSTIIGSISLVLVPKLSEDFYRKNTRRLRQNLQRGLLAALLISAFLIPFFHVLGKDLGLLAFSDALAGEFIQKGCLLLLPMSLTMISTAMLNSLGFEKQTFLFYFIGAAAMLLCILFLPALCGAYAYVLGLGASFILTALCNLIFLGKKCPDLFPNFKKLRGYVWKQPVFKALILILPISLIGGILHPLFCRIFGAVLPVLFSALCIAAVTVLIWCLSGILPVKRLLSAYKSRRRAKRRTAVI